MRLRHIPEADDYIHQSPFCISNPEEMKGKWSSIFPSSQPLYIEIGMGKGRFITGMAKAHPENNYLGLEYYSSVLLRAAQKLDEMEEKPENLFLICRDAALLNEFFIPGELSGIYLNFSDPWPKDRHAKRRLTSSRYRELYAALLPSGSPLEFKTDNSGLFEYCLEEFKADPNFELTVVTDDLHNDPVLSAGNIMTEYEEKFSSMGNPIHKLIAIRN